MAVSQARLNRYRKDLDGIGDAAYSFVDEFIRATISNNPGMSVAELRNETIDAIDSSLYAFGDQASELALDLFEEIVVDGHGLDAETVIEDAIDPKMIEGGVRYSARQLVEGDTEAFARDVADLTRYYVKRSAMENMVRNCERNDLRYARVPSGRETCAFCFMLSSRGFVYRSEQTAGRAHAYHENCDCVIVPGFEGLPADEQVEGYDPDGMLDRWYDCDSAIDWDGAKERWESMDSVQRGRYKGDSDYERYASYVNAQVRREVETRDWRWLYTGELPKQTKERGAKPLQKEKATADALSKAGFPVKFIKEVNKTRVKTADAYLNEDVWEFKVPEGWSGEHTVRKQFYKARDKGTSKLVLSLLENGADLDEAYPLVRKTLDGGDYPYIDEVLIVGRDGSLIRVK